MKSQANVDGNALISALRYSPAKFAKLRADLLKNGVTDGDIVRAMAASRLMIDCLGPLATRVPRPRYGKK